MKAADLPKAMEIVQNQADLAKLVEQIEIDGTARPIIRVALLGKLPKTVEINDLVSEGCLELVTEALLQGIREMQEINRDALAEYGVTEE